jgi:hypothetical protein
MIFSDESRMNWSLATFSSHLPSSAAPQRLAQIDFLCEKDTAITKLFFVGCKASALEVNPCGLCASYKLRCAEIAVIKNVKDCQITAAIAVGQVGQNLLG